MRNNILNKLTILASLIFLNSCHTYSTSLNEMESLNMEEVANTKQGKSCSKNLFGAFKLPYFGDTAIKLSGDESVMAAIKNGNIQNVYAVDQSTQNYIFYSKRCTIVFGR